MKASMSHSDANFVSDFHQNRHVGRRDAVQMNLDLNALRGIFPKSIFPQHKSWSTCSLQAIIDLKKKKTLKHSKVGKFVVLSSNFKRILESVMAKYYKLKDLPEEDI